MTDGAIRASVSGQAEAVRELTSAVCQGFGALTMNTSKVNE